MNTGKLARYFSASKYFLIPCFHVAMLCLVYQWLQRSSFISGIDFFFFKQWDAFWYSSIAEHGYQYSATESSNSGFFPLFPYEWKLLWKLTDAGVPGVCLFNMLIFFAGMLLLKKTFNFSWPYFLLFVSIPSNMFMYVPYTEATFFFFSAVLLSGLKKQNFYMVIIGLFFASLTKPTAVFFIPAIIVMEILTFESIKKFVKNCVTYSFVPLFSILIVLVMQYKATGIWFAYFKAQSKFWSRTFQIPEFPLTTWDGVRLIWLDGFAIFFGLMAIGLLAALILKKVRKRETPEISNPVVFSLCYLVMTLFSILFFNAKDISGGTSLMGANRYLLATPYFVLLLLFITHDLKINMTFWLGYILLATGVVFLLSVESTYFISLSEEDKIYYRLLILLYIGLFALIPKQLNNRFIALIYLINVIIQICIMSQFVKTVWIG